MRAARLWNRLTTCGYVCVGAVVLAAANSCGTSTPTDADLFGASSGRSPAGGSAVGMPGTLSPDQQSRFDRDAARLRADATQPGHRRSSLPTADEILPDPFLMGPRGTVVRHPYCSILDGLASVVMIDENRPELPVVASQISARLADPVYREFVVDMAPNAVKTKVEVWIGALRDWSVEPGDKAINEVRRAAKDAVKVWYSVSC